MPYNITSPNCKAVFIAKSTTTSTAKEKNRMNMPSFVLPFIKDKYAKVSTIIKGNINSRKFLYGSVAKSTSSIGTLYALPE
jgi:hypothetical protein